MKLLQDGDIEAAVKLVKRSARTVHYRAQTIVNTLRLGRSRGSALDKALQSGVTRFKYVGPSFNIRPFCREHLNKTYTIDEIRDMDNGQELPVAEFCGGHNCQHRWVSVVVTAKEELEELKTKEIAWSPKDFKSDSKKHIHGFGYTDVEKYKKDAIDLVKRQANPHIKEYEGQEQFLFFGEDGYVVCDKSGMVRGYYHSRDTKKTIEKLKEKKGCKKI